MKNLILILLFCFNLSCANYNAEREKIRLEKKKIAYEHQLNLDKITCKKYGFEESTTNFSKLSTSSILFAILFDNSVINFGG